MAGGVLVLVAALIAYHNSLSGPLIFDDSAAITDNPSIRQLWPIGPVLAPPAECTVAGRPLANLTFAVNFALGRTSVWGYHAFNLLLHLLAALLLHGIVGRTLLRLGTGPGTPGAAADRLAQNARALAMAVSAIWAVHPLLTGSVTYISQRTELMMGVFYFLTLYAFIRGEEGSTRGWRAVSVAACLCGIASKEVMVTAPVLVFLYDRAFVSGTFRAACRRWPYYASLGATWLLLPVLMSGLQHRAVGFGLGVPWWKYALTECGAVWTYVQLVFWPHPLIFDYGVAFVENALSGALLAVGIGLALAGAVVGFRRWPRAAFPLVAFFLILAPTSSVVPVATQPIAENRVYLPSAALIAATLAAGFVTLGRKTWTLGAVAALALILLTVQRNETFSSRLSIWTDTAAKRPKNPRAFENVGEAFYELGRLGEARQQFEQALRLDPTFAAAHNNLGTTLRALGDRAGAIGHFQQSVLLKPDYAIARNNLGNALAEVGRLDDARRELEEALRIYADPDRLKPDLAETHNNMGNVLLYQGLFEQARPHYEAAVRLKPDFPQAQMNLGVALRQLGLIDRALERFGEALRLRPAFPEVQFNLGVTLQQMGRTAEARRSYEEAVRLAPQFHQAHRNLGEVLAQEGDIPGAMRHYEEALRLRPDDLVTRENLQALRRR